MSSTDNFTPGSLNPNAIPVEQLAGLLSKLTRYPITTRHLESDIMAGAPKNPDGSIHIVHYTAWLVRELRKQERKEDQHG